MATQGYPRWARSWPGLSLRLRGVAFDLDHTLARDHHLEVVVLEDMARRAGLPMEGFRPRAEAALGPFRQGQASMQDMLAGLLPGQDPQELERAFVEGCLRLCPRLLEPVPGAPEVLGGLHRAGWPMALLSNGWTRLQKLKAELVGFPGPVYVSQEIGYWKPDARAFLYVCRQLGLDAAGVLYVGDSPSSDIAGACYAGLPTAWFNPEGKPYPPDLPRPDFELRSLAQLEEVLVR